MKLALVDIAKSGGNPVLNLPPSVEVKKSGQLWHLIHPTEGQLFARVVFENANRWVAQVAAPARAYQWIENHLGANVYELTWSFYQTNKAQLAALGLVGEIRDGADVLRMPHVICGQSPFVAQ